MIDLKEEEAELTANQPDLLLHLF